MQRFISLLRFVCFIIPRREAQWLAKRAERYVPEIRRPTEVATTSPGIPSRSYGVQIAPLNRLTLHS